jgi:N6-adenosine-specific RNA methylase IME4
MHHRIGHSVKPPVIRDRIVRLFGNLSRLEIFARQEIEGWDAIGYDIDGISVQEKIKIINKSEYKLYISELKEKEHSVENIRQPALFLGA